MTLIVGILGVASAASAGEVVEPAPFDSLLSTYVDSEGLVDYAALEASDESRKKLENYLEAVAEADLEGHEPDERLAFYLNAYNAATIAAILEEWPVDSPKSIEGFFNDRKHRVAGRDMTLDKLEHGIIRKDFDEARIHFVLVCAARSCPRLRRTALTSSNLERELRAAAEEFVPKVTRLEDGKVVTSALFDWFSEDFADEAGSVRDYLAKYVEGKVAKALEDEKVDVRFRDYDWTVNSQSSP